MLLNLNFESSSDVIVGILIVLIRCAATEIFFPMFVAEKVKWDRHNADIIKPAEKYGYHDIIMILSCSQFHNRII